MHPIINIATKAARNGGNVIMRHIDRIDTLTVSSKQENDFVSEVDRMAEQEIINTLQQAYPNYGILAEESGEQIGKEEYQWIIDPLDGTTNFLHGFPQFGISIALAHKGRIEHGVIYDPVRQELFTASRGAGAQMNNRKLRVSRRTGLTGSLLGTGFPYKDFEALDVYMNTFKALVPNCAGVRRAGAACLDLAYVAAGRLDGFWEFGLGPWDMAAGALMVREAGGMVSDLTGGDGFMESGDIVAASARAHDPMLEVLRPHVSRLAR